MSLTIGFYTTTSLAQILQQSGTLLSPLAHYSKRANSPKGQFYRTGGDANYPPI